MPVLCPYGTLFILHVLCPHGLVTFIYSASALPSCCLAAADSGQIGERSCVVNGVTGACQRPGIPASRVVVDTPVSVTCGEPTAAVSQNSSAADNEGTLEARVT